MTGWRRVIPKVHWQFHNYHMRCRQISESDFCNIETEWSWELRIECWKGLCIFPRGQEQKGIHILEGSHRKHLPFDKTIMTFTRTFRWLWTVISAWIFLRSCDMRAGGIRNRYCELCRNEGYDRFPPADFVVNAPKTYKTKSREEAPRSMETTCPFAMM